MDIEGSFRRAHTRVTQAMSFFRVSQIQFCLHFYFPVRAKYHAHLLLEFMITIVTDESSVCKLEIDQYAEICVASHCHQAVFRRSNAGKNTRTLRDKGTQITNLVVN
jgi:hypothetical protein